MPPSQYHIYQTGCLFSTLELLLLCTHQILSSFCFTKAEQGDVQYCWDISLMERRIFLMGNRCNQRVSLPLMLQICPAENCDGDADEVWLSAEQQKGEQVNNKGIIQTSDISVSFFSLFLFPSVCLFLSFSSPCSLISLSSLLMPLFVVQVVLLGLSMKLVSVSQLSTQSPYHLSDTAVTVCLLIILRLGGGVFHSSCLLN